MRQGQPNLHGLWIEVFWPFVDISGCPLGGNLNAMISGTYSERMFCVTSLAMARVGEVVSESVLTCTLFWTRCKDNSESHCFIVLSRKISLFFIAT